VKYTILVYENAADFGARTDAGVMVGGAGLQPPPLATTIRLRDGKRQVQDGPFADTKEQLGGLSRGDVARRRGRGRRAR
jgi:hypothetical protein